MRRVGGKAIVYRRSGAVLLTIGLVGVLLGVPGARSASTTAVPRPHHTAGKRFVIEDPDDADGSLDIGSVAIRQHLRQLKIAIHSRGNFSLKRLDRHPPLEPSRLPSLCVLLRRHGAHAVRRICLAGAKRKHVALAKIKGNRHLTKTRLVPARVTRRRPSEVTITLKGSQAKLGPNVYALHALSDWSGGSCDDSAAHTGGHRRGPSERHRADAGKDVCLDRAPDHGTRRIRIRPLVSTGCRAKHKTTYHHGPRGKKRVALTFDDGPSTYTPQVLRILKHFHIHSTFFEIGDNVRNYPELSRMVHNAGMELANHSMHHSTKPGAADLAQVNRVLEHATGFKPCLFRPPGGASDSSVEAGARSDGMATIIWDVDPRDWSTPGTGAIESNVLAHTRPGSIILNHDGGGPRGETVAALPKVIRTLKHRGYKFMTVSKLLHNRTRYALK